MAVSWRPIVVSHALVDRQLEELACDLDGEVVVLARAPGPLGATVMTGWLGRGAGGEVVEVGLSTPVMRATERFPASADPRLPGAAASEIALLGHGLNYCRDINSALPIV